MDTMALDFALWDLDVDQYGNMATFGDATPGELTGPAMRMAQDTATQCLAFRGEVYYDTTQGVRYDQILGNVPNMVFITSEYQTQALNVPEVAQAVPSLTFVRGGPGAPNARTVTGTIYVSDATGTAGVVNL
jgi:hypothetical protein